MSGDNQGDRSAPRGEKAGFQRDTGPPHARMEAEGDAAAQLRLWAPGQSWLLFGLGLVSAEPPEGGGRIHAGMAPHGSRAARSPEPQEPQIMS